ncbi:MAG: hypothetical protein UT84_C0002G0073 [Candidatus Curtissbacteria bacterium GW2011_GWA1_40_16]|uniref:Uncharacterized protein n=1 Tax=Candidatus Curtissbacteria bacterium GW2011_GWA1_40_16 TaxID=1618405 RepID=A0A0G0ULX1_9BACT|nr:MAG: hypothetical protein UT84_C0002G0073 [Candidatus Curtissbacteria bacterium GW2011_GWA1_40_16]
MLERRGEYEPKLGWNFELRFNGDGNVVPEFKYLQRGKSSDEGTGESGKDKQLRSLVACDLSKGCFVINPNPPMYSERAYTIEELAYHLQLVGLPPQSELVLRAMREAKAAIKTLDAYLTSSATGICQAVFEEAGLAVPHAWTLDTPITKNGLREGYKIYRRRFPQDESYGKRVAQAIEDLFAQSIEKTIENEGWRDEGGQTENWLVRDPDRLLGVGNGLDFSSVILQRHEHETPMGSYIFSTTVANRYPVADIFASLKGDADHVSISDYRSGKSVEDTVYNFELPM